MLSPDDNPGIFYFLVGMVVLVMTAVGLSLIIDKRVKFSAGAGEFSREVAATSEELATLRSTHQARSDTLAEFNSRLGASAGSLDDTRRKISSVEEVKAGLVERKEALTRSVGGIEQAFAAYRETYRSRTWADAVGRKFGVLAIRGGREFKEVTITKVTDVGLEIRHEHGIARIQAPDLDGEWQDRFQWDDEKRRASLKAESAAFEPKPTQPDGEAVETPDAAIPRVAPPVSEASDAEKAEQIRLLRSQVLAWSTKVIRLRSEVSIASSQAGAGNQNSVPGSLETWKARSARLGNELTRATIELNLARSRLGAVSPDDSLLRMRTADSP